MKIGEAEVEVGDGLTVTRFSDGRVTSAVHAEQPGQAETAANAGYPSAEALNRDHDVTHSLLAHWLGLPHSPTLHAVACGEEFPLWRDEEAAVLAVQRFAQRMGVDLLEVARGL